MTTETLDKPIKSAGYFTDGVGAADEHLRLSAGNIDFETFFTALEPYGPPPVITKMTSIELATQIVRNRIAVNSTPEIPGRVICQNWRRGDAPSSDAAS